MKLAEKRIIEVQAVISAPVETVWKCWTTPGDIVRWNHASEEWHTPAAENDLRKGGKFLYRMEARDGSFGFDFGGVYDEVKTNKIIEYTLGDGRKVKITFSPLNDKTEVVETFEAESTNPAEIQRGGWQAILDNFKKLVEGIKY